MLDGISKERSASDSGLASLALMMRFFNLPADPEQIRHDYGREDADRRSYPRR